MQCLSIDYMECIRLLGSDLLKPLSRIVCKMRGRHNYEVIWFLRIGPRNLRVQFCCRYPLYVPLTLEEPPLLVRADQSVVNCPASLDVSTAIRAPLPPRKLLISKGHQ